MAMNSDVAQKDNVIPLIPVQSACCAPVNISASSCGCEAGKPVATVVNEQGNTVSACCGKPVDAQRTSGACCG